MTFVLYASKGSGSFPVEAGLVKVGAPFEIVTVDIEKGEQAKPEFVALNPMKQVPALKLPDGTLMTESAAIVIHLANVFPDKGLAPPVGSSAHARFLRWMLFMATNVYEGDLRYFYPQRYTTDPAGLAGVKAAGANHMRMSFDVIEKALDPFVCGKEFSLADAYLAMLCTWSPEPLASKKLKAVMAAVASDGHYGPVWQRNFPAT